jgi:hypothetical protein
VSSDEGDSWSEIAGYLPGISSVGWRARLMAELHLPTTLTPLFPDLPRRIDVEAASVWRDRRARGARPGVRDRLCEQALRMHIHVYVDRTRASLDTPLQQTSRVDVVAAISGGSGAASCGGRRSRGRRGRR